MYTAINIKGTESRFGSYNFLNMYGYATSEALKPQKIWHGFGTPRSWLYGLCVGARLCSQWFRAVRDVLEFELTWFHATGCAAWSLRLVKGLREGFIRLQRL